MELADISEQLRKMPQYQELMNRYSAHIEISGQVHKSFNKRELLKLIALEQNIISGLDSRGKEINNSAIVKEMSQISKDLSPQDHARLLNIYLSCYELGEKDRDTLLKSLQGDDYR